MKNSNPTFLTSFFRELRYVGKLRPERDWLVLLSMMAVLLLASIAWNVWFFAALITSESSAPVVNATYTTSSAASVTNVQNVFKVRATEQNNYQQTYHFVDPSL